MPQVKYKCRNTGKYPLPETITEWPVCTKKPVRPEIKRAIQVNIYRGSQNNRILVKMEGHNITPVKVACAKKKGGKIGK